MGVKVPLVAVLFLFVLALAPPVSAQSCRAAPGQAAIEQYCESVPGAGGDRGRSDPGGGSPRGDLPPELGNSADGIAVVGFTLFTSEPGGSDVAGEGRQGRGRDGNIARSAEVGTGATLDSAFAWVLGGLLAGVLAAGAIRWTWRRRTAAV
jgi:hypothetical protein